MSRSGTVAATTSCTAASDHSPVAIGETYIGFPSQDAHSFAWTQIYLARGNLSFTALRRRTPMPADVPPSAPQYPASPPVGPPPPPAAGPASPLGPPPFPSAPEPATPPSH